MTIDSNGHRLIYKYEIRRAKPGSPTLIAIPGGPGQGLIGHLNFVKSGDFVPADYGIITIDPRGVGSNNYGSDRRNDFYTSKDAAKDIVQVVQHEKLNNYFIHGQSYGTVLATMSGHLIESTNMPKPRGVILSGVVADAFQDSLKGYNSQLHRLFKLYPDPEQHKIISNLKKLEDSFNGNKRLFSMLLLNSLVKNSEDASSNGVNNVNMRRFFDEIRDGNFESKNQIMEFMKMNASGKPKELVIQRNNSMPEVIKCHELTKNDGMLDLHFDFETFSLVSELSDCEKKGYVLDRPYHSVVYQIQKTPIIYVQGSLDPATPLDQAKSHFEQQESKDKVFIQLDNYAHNALDGLWPCQNGFWGSLEKGVQSLKDHILSCQRKEIKILSEMPHASQSSQDSMGVQ